MKTVLLFAVVRVRWSDFVDLVCIPHPLPNHLQECRERSGFRDEAGTQNGQARKKEDKGTVIHEEIRSLSNPALAYRLENTKLRGAPVPRDTRGGATLSFAGSRTITLWMDRANRQPLSYWSGHTNVFHVSVDIFLLPIDLLLSRLCAARLKVSAIHL